MAQTDYGQVEEGVSMTTEVTRKNRKNANVPGSGLYRHPESGQEAIVQSDPLWGNTQAQAFARLGFKFVREAKEGEIKTLPELAADARNAEADTVKGLLARVNAVEQAAEENKSLSSEVADLRKKLEESEKAREEAEAQIKEAGKKATSGAEERSFTTAKLDAARVQNDRDAGTDESSGGKVVNGDGHNTANVGQLGTPGSGKDAKPTNETAKKEEGTK